MTLLNDRDIFMPKYLKLRLYLKFKTYLQINLISQYKILVQNLNLQRIAIVDHV